VIVISHRLSTLGHVDEIAVLEAGRIVERGTYKELKARAGAFAHLLAEQNRYAAEPMPDTVFDGKQLTGADGDGSRPTGERAYRPGTLHGLPKRAPSGNGAAIPSTTTRRQNGHKVAQSVPAAAIQVRPDWVPVAVARARAQPLGRDLKHERPGRQHRD
jgi:ABC-type multidrug transport system ATPase subunit